MGLLERISQHITKNPYLWTLLGLTVLAAVPRLYQLGSASMWNDEGSSSLFALGILNTGQPIIPGRPEAIPAVDLEVFYSYLEAFSFKLLGISNLSARLPSAVAGILLVPASYLLGARLRNSMTGIALAVLVAFSTELIGWSRQAREYSLLCIVVVLLFLVLERVSNSQTRWVRVSWVCLAAVLAGIAGTSDLGLSILYAPGAVLGLLVYDSFAHPERIPTFFGFPKGFGTLQVMSQAPKYRTRRWLFVAGCLILLTAVAIPLILGAASVSLFQHLVSFTPYKFTLTTYFLTYLAAFYPWIVAFSAIGLFLTIRRKDPRELALLAFLIITILSLSSIISFFTNISGGAPIYERYLTPLIPILFYFAAVGILTCLEVLSRSIKSVYHLIPQGRGARTILVTLGVAVVLLGPSVILPSSATLYQSAVDSSADSTVPWIPFSPFPSDPSALYGLEQPNYQLACDYIETHRAPGDVVAAIWPDVPTFYLGRDQYWIFTNPPTGAAVSVNGTYEYYLTGSIDVTNLTQLEPIMFNTSGWFILDWNSRGAVGGNMSLAVDLLMSPVPMASDVSETLYHWNKLNVSVLLSVLESNRPDLQAAFGNNTTELIDWAAVFGVTSLDSRAILLPIESNLVQLAAPSTVPLAVLIDVYNHRPDLQREFPEVIAKENFTGLLKWADMVVTGQISDPAYATLEPYASYYEMY